MLLDVHHDPATAKSPAVVELACDWAYQHDALDEALDLHAEDLLRLTWHRAR